MKHIKLFENFVSSGVAYIYVANPKAEQMLVDSPLSENLEINEGAYYGSYTEKAVLFLESKGFISPQDFIVTEALDVKLIGMSGDKLEITIGGHKYGYEQKEGDLDIKEIARKFEKMLQFSAGKALVWLKKHTDLKSGGKGMLDADTAKVEESAETKNYMFFQNLKTIQEAVAKLLALDTEAVDAKLEDGHDWANDHIATSKDDIEEVCGFLCNSVNSIVGVKESFIQDYFQNGEFEKDKTEELKLLKQLKGKRIKLDSMGVDPRSGKADPDPIPNETEGIIVSVDDMGTLHVKWDNGRTLGVVPRIDKFTILPTKK